MQAEGASGQAEQAGRVGHIGLLEPPLVKMVSLNVGDIKDTLKRTIRKIVLHFSVDFFGGKTIFIGAISPSSSVRNDSRNDEKVCFKATGRVDESEIFGSQVT